MPKSKRDLYCVPFDGHFSCSEAPTSPPKKDRDKKKNKKRLEALTEALDDLQQRLYASDQFSLLLIFQAMDAAGKDSTIRAVLKGINPAGCQVFSFKQPSAEELDHDFLWRTARALPERGRIGVFNRSYYEEVLVVRVHPEYLKYQKLPEVPDLADLWNQRYESIRDHERHLARNGTVILKFWLNVSKAEQKRRFLSRLDESEKNWKFSEGDLKERILWPEYLQAYEEALKATSRDYAPWFAIPADDKPYMRATVAQIIVDRLNELGLSYPKVDELQMNEFTRLKNQLEDPSS